MPRQIKIDVLDQDYSIAGPKLKNTSQAKRILNKNNLSSKLDTKKAGTGFEAMLSNMGVTIVAMDEKDFSFMNDEKNIELLQNPNILQKRSFKKLKNKKTNTIDKFSNEDDPFYELDDPRDSRDVTEENANTIDEAESLADIAKDIFALNLSNNTAVKQFRSLE